jgi:zinc transport system permease protein
MHRVPPLLALADEHWLTPLITAFTGLFPSGTFLSFSFNVQALLALILVSVVCGSVGSLVVGGRMAFFSDALAHCAFAGISLGFVFFEAVVAGSRPANEFWGWVTPVMVLFGALVGAGIAYVRSNSGLSSDTVIGVFFAASVGLAGALRKLIHNRNLFNLEDFLFGDPLLVGPGDLVHLAVLALVTALILGWTFNRLLLAGFNPSLALSRRVPVARDSYLVIILLALIVNLCLRSIGVLLINALLVVPAATAVNLSTNLRQVFWLSIGVCLACCVGGHLLSWELGAGAGIDLGVPGTVVLLSCGLFTLSLCVGPSLRRRTGALRPRADGGVRPAA